MTREEAIKFLEKLISTVGDGFHPDDPMTNYFSTFDAQFVEEDLKMCFEVLGDEIYDISLKLIDESIKSL